MVTLRQIARHVAKKQAARDIERLTDALLAPPGLGQEESHDAEVERLVFELAGLPPSEWRNLDIFGKRTWLEKAVAAMPPTKETAVETPADKRNAWIYGQAMKGVAWGDIRRKLKTKPKDWERLESDQGVKDAAKRYAKSYGLPLPLARKGGRPKT